MSKPSDDKLIDLPEVKTANRSVRRELEQLIREAHSLKDLEKRSKEVRDRIKEIVQAESLCSQDGKFGARVGELCVLTKWSDGRRSLDRAKLVENGVTVEQLEASMKQGEGFWTCEVMKIGTD